MKTAFICLLVLVVAILSGCGESAETPSATSTPTTATTASSTSTPVPAATSTSTPTATADNIDTTTPASNPTGTVAEVTTPTATEPATEPESTPTPTATPTPDAITQEDIDAARQVVFDYWEAFNAYDLEGVLSYLEESWRQENAESLESDMGRLKAFGTTLGVSEEADPVVTPDGKIEIRIKLKTPLGSRHVLYQLVKVDSVWKICYTEE